MSASGGLRFGSKLNLGGHPGGSGDSAEGWEETENSSYSRGGSPSSLSLDVFVFSSFNLFGCSWREGVGVGARSCLRC